MKSDRRHKSNLDEIKWVCNTSIYTDTGESRTVNEAMSRPNIHLWNMSYISDVKKFLSRKAWILMKRSRLKAKGIEPLPVK